MNVILQFPFTVLFELNGEIKVFTSTVHVHCTAGLLCAQVHRVTNVRTQGNIGRVCAAVVRVESTIRAV